MILSPRLKAISEKILPGEPLADVGTDHGYLPLHLLDSGLVPAVVATEVNEGPRRTALKNLADYLTTGEAEVLLGDGLEPVPSGAVTQVAISGMGGELILRILERGGDKLKGVKRLILQPMSQSEALREFLLKTGWRIVDETILKEMEGGKPHYYQIIAAERGSMDDFGEFDFEFGYAPSRKLNADFSEYLEYKASLYESRIQMMAKSNNEQTNRRRLDFQRRLLYVRSLLNESV